MPKPFISPSQLRAATVALVALFAVVMAGCKSAPPAPPETTAQLELAVASDVNPDSDGRPSPIVVTLYVLKDARQFEREDFLSLYQNAASRLGADLVDTVKLRELVPGEKRTEKVSLKPEARYIGLVAEYVQYDKAKSMIALPVVANSNNVFNVQVERLQLTGAKPQ